MTYQIEATKLRQTFGDRTVLEDVTFTLEPNRIYGLLGRNGSGKSTLLSILAAFRKPTGGAVAIEGQPLFENPALTSQIALIRESGDTVEDSEKTAKALQTARDLRPNWDNDYAEQLLRRFHVPMDTKISKMSRGQRSALGIVLGLAARAPITIFDETYLGLDAPSRVAFYDEILNDYMRHPRTFIISTHLIEEVSQLFEDVLILHQGRLLLHEPQETLINRAFTVTGLGVDVQEATAGLNALGERRLGRMLAKTIYGAADEGVSDRLRARGFEVDSVSLQDLFVHLTREPGEDQ